MSKRPVETIRDELLGPVTWTDDSEEWQAEFALDTGRPIDLTCSAADGPTAVALLRLAVAWLPVGDPAARRFAATSELELFNDEWRDRHDDPEPITPDEFAARLTLSGVDAHEDGALTLWYNAGGMFTEHAFCVDVDAAGEFTDAGMQ